MKSKKNEEERDWRRRRTFFWKGVLMKNFLDLVHPLKKISFLRTLLIFIFLYAIFYLSFHLHLLLQCVNLCQSMYGCLLCMFMALMNSLISLLLFLLVSLFLNTQSLFFSSVLKVVWWFRKLFYTADTLELTFWCVSVFERCLYAFDYCI